MGYLSGTRRNEVPRTEPILYTYHIYKMLQLVHYTSRQNLQKILDSGRILDQLGRHKMKVVTGEGDTSRICCYPTNTYKGIESQHKTKQTSTKKPPKCTEGCGVYFRIVKPGQKIVPPRKTQVALVFSQSLLRRYKWHINFCENNGLYMDDHIPWYGDDSNTNCPNSSSTIAAVMATEFNQRDGEIIVYESIDLKDLVQIIDSTGTQNVEGVYGATTTRSRSNNRTKSSSKSRKPSSYSSKSSTRKTI